VQGTDDHAILGSTAEADGWLPPARQRNNLIECHSAHNYSAAVLAASSMCSAPASFVEHRQCPVSPRQDRRPYSTRFVNLAQVSAGCLRHGHDRPININASGRHQFRHTGDTSRGPALILRAPGDTFSYRSPRGVAASREGGGIDALICGVAADFTGDADRIEKAEFNTAPLVTSRSHRFRHSFSRRSAGQRAAVTGEHRLPADFTLDIGDDHDPSRHQFGTNVLVVRVHHTIPAQYGNEIVGGGADISRARRTTSSYLAE